MTVKSKILVPMTIISFIMALIVLISGIVVFSNYIDETMTEEVGTFSEQLEYQLDSLWDSATLSSTMVANDSDIRQALAANDRDKLASWFSSMSSVLETDFCTLTDSQGNVVYRSHEPNDFGDNIISQENIEGALKGKTTVQLEEGTAVKLSVRAGVPLYDENGELIGAVSTGFRLDTNDFVDEIKEITNAEVTIFLGDTRLSTTVILISD